MNKFTDVIKGEYHFTEIWGVSYGNKVGKPFALCQTHAKMIVSVRSVASGRGDRALA